MTPDRQGRFNQSNAPGLELGSGFHLTSPDWRYDIHEEKIQFVVMLHFPIFLVVVVTDCPVTGTLLGGSGILETVMTALCQPGE